MDFKTTNPIIMWRNLQTGEMVSVGDIIRFTSIYPGRFKDPFTVVKAEPHYFQIAPNDDNETDDRRKRVVKYYEIGYYLKVEVWKQ